MATGELETGREFDEGGTTPRYAERRPIGSLLVQPQSSEIAESKKTNFRVIYASFAETVPTLERRIPPVNIKTGKV